MVNIGQFLKKHLLTPSGPPPKRIQARTTAGTLLYTHNFNGEKNLGGIGPVKGYAMDYDGLRARSYQSLAESEITQTVIKKFTLSVIGSGLKMQANPNKNVLLSEGINIDTEAFNKVAETRFALWANSRISDHAGMKNANILLNRGFKHKLVGGDVLMVQRYINNQVKLQIIDGAHICSPMYGNDWYPYVLANGNEIRNGIEMDKTGRHIAYYVKQDDYTFERIEARGAKTGLLMAFLVYGEEYRIDNNRGIPLICTVLETLKKMERYKEAVVGNAEERAKIVYQIVHTRDSTGESPLLQQMAKARNADFSNDELPVDEQGRQLANIVAATTEKATYNMPIGSEMKALDSRNELYFKDFYDKNFDIVCASIGIPPNVAMSLYNDSFSASRAAIEDWKLTLKVNRDDYSFQTYQPIYEFWLHTEILKGKIKAPGYLEAFKVGNTMVLDAYRNARFIGAYPSHIDPLKEANAVRAMLGETGVDMPLITLEQGTEILNGGDSESNLAQFAEELKKSKSLGIKPEPELVTGMNQG